MLTPVTARATTALALLACAASACAPAPDVQAKRSIADGSAAKALQAQLDARPQCAPVLTGLTPITLDATSAGYPGPRALVDTGLMTRSATADGGAQLDPAPAEAKAFRETRTTSGKPASLTLCYARRQVVRVWDDTRDGGEPRLRYAYRLVDAPAWTHDPRMTAAFPFLPKALGTTLKADESVPFRDGRWDLTLMEPSIRLPDEVEGFWACPTGATSDAPLRCS